MEKNMGSQDKNIRLIIGAILLVIGFFSSFWLSIIGVVLIATSLMGFCPAYVPFKINTNKDKK
ncbi:MAG: DUF2892 domain-containing protein [Ignavibacteriae bacterium]|nr:DUF2892 domain-containing protein [Ignavibacteriota bacterium]MCB9209166.1 DUF2892 domain-containing protein [Ignavibacteriales bacterium]MCB9219584.1 DUF2892 domain-containing protein [Ignavibacteriales bacterium]